MKIINNQWFVSVIFLVLGFFVGQLFPSRSLYSATQYIRFWPPSLGGNDRLTLDNLITLKMVPPFNEQTITLLAGAVPLEERPVDVPLLKVEGIQYTKHNLTQRYLFNVSGKKTHKISIGGRSFYITLNKIKKIPLENVSSALEYEFGISELSQVEKIKDFFE